MENSMTFDYAKRVIEQGKYGVKDTFQLKLDVFFMGERVNQEEYDSLTKMLSSA